MTLVSVMTGVDGATTVAAGLVLMTLTSLTTPSSSITVTTPVVLDTNSAARCL